MYPLWQIIGVSIIPGFLWLWVFYRQDAYEPEPRRILLMVFGLGMLAVAPAFLLELPWRPLLQSSLGRENLLILAFVSFIIIGGIEEACKSIPLLLVLRRLREFDEPLDGIIYGVTVGLGFAALENLLYTLGHSPAIGLFRAAVTPLAHASFSGWFGYFLAKARFASQPGSVGTGFVVAVAIHGAYDYLLLSSSGTAGIASFVVIGVALGLLLRKMRQLEQWSPFSKSRSS